MALPQDNVDPAGAFGAVTLFKGAGFMNTVVDRDDGAQHDA
jgi:hypothetical protein